MKLILEEDINYKTRINDFGVEPINKRIITTGEKLIYFNKGKFEKESGGKVKNCEIIKSIVCFQYIFCFYSKWKSI